MDYTFLPAGLVLLTFFSFVESAQVLPTDQIGFVNGLSDFGQATVCASYVVPGQPLPTDSNQAEAYKLRDWSSKLDGCDPKFNESIDALAKFSPVDSLIVAVDYCILNCSVQCAENAAYGAWKVQNLGGKGLLLIAPTMFTTAPTLEQMRNLSVTIPTGVIPANKFLQIQALGERSTVKEYSYPHQFYMEYATLIIWLVAVCGIALGTLWDRYIHFPLNRDDEDYEVNGKGNIGGDVKNGVAGTKQEVNLSVDDKKKEAAANNKRLGFSIIKITVFIIVMTLIQILLYYFYDVVIYVIYAIFFFITVPPTFSILSTFKRFFPCFSYELSCRKRSIDIRNVVFFLVALTLYIVWIIYRKESYSWALQDALIIFTIVRMTGRLHLYDLKICTVILVLLSLYFTFIIFGTPSMTAEGKSILEVVIAGKGGPTAQSDREKMPMTFRIPQITSDPLAMCFHRESAISFVDIIVPGAIISYCYEFGVKAGAPVQYLLTGLTSYGLGLGLSFITQYMTRQLQPALLFISPCLLISVITLSFIRKEFCQLWNGKPEVKEKPRRIYAPVAQSESSF